MGKNQKIVWQILDLFRGEDIDLYPALVLALQALAWARLSTQGRLPAHLALQDHGFDSAYLTDPTKAWAAIRDALPDVSAAFAEAPKRISKSAVRAAVELAVRLAESGHLDEFDPTDTTAEIMASREPVFSPPAEVSDLLVRLARVPAGGAVYLPWDQSGALLGRLLHQGAAVVAELPGDVQLPALVALFTGEECRFLRGDPIRQPLAVSNGRLTTFDVSVAFPPLGMRYPADVTEQDLYGRFPERTTSGGVLMIRHLMAQTQRRVVIAITNNVLFSSGSEQRFREALLQERVLEAVIAMPAKLLHGTAIGFSIMVLNLESPQDGVRFINADDPRFFTAVTRARMQLQDVEGIVERADALFADEHVAIVPVEEVIRNDAQLEVGRYVLPEEQKRLEQWMRAARTVPLGEIVSFVRPIPSSAEGGDVSVQEVGATDLPEFGYIGNASRLASYSPDVINRYRDSFLRPRDLVLLIKGNVGKVGIVPDDVPPPGEGGWVAGQAAIVLRGRESSMVDPRVLLVFLRSNVGQSLLKTITSGATIGLIRLRELEKLEVVVPEPAQAQEVMGALATEASLEQQITELRNQQAEQAGRFWSLA